MSLHYGEDFRLEQVCPAGIIDEPTKVAHVAYSGDQHVSTNPQLTVEVTRHPELWLSPPEHVT